MNIQISNASSQVVNIITTQGTIFLRPNSVIICTEGDVDYGVLTNLKAAGLINFINTNRASTILSRSLASSTSYTGVDGQTGLMGVTGVQGSTGTRGITGLQGVTGSQGFTGVQGITGIQGTTGIQGVTGLWGVTGSQGFTGVGATGVGATGLWGITGLRGITGIQGVTGIGATGVGATGIQGITGLQGITGAQGITGILGITGVGTTGIQGITGSLGLTGAQGITGIGATGIRGATGQGATGTQGNTGAGGIAIGISGHYVSVGGGYSIQYPTDYVVARTTGSGAICHTLPAITVSGVEVNNIQFLILKDEAGSAGTYNVSVKGSDANSGSGHSDFLDGVLLGAGRVVINSAYGKIALYGYSSGFVPTSSTYWFTIG